MHKNLFCLFLMTIIFLFLSGCDNKVGSPYVEPSKNTIPTISFGSDRYYLNPSMMTFGTGSADLSVKLGSKTFTFGASDVTLQSYGIDYGTMTSRFQTNIDSRGIHGVRQGFYILSPTNTYNAAGFHIMAKADDGNVYLLEYSILQKWGKTDYYTLAHPELLLKKEVAVGESWVTQFSILPSQFNIKAGIRTTLLSDSTTAPVSQEEDTILLFVQGDYNLGFYIYLKEGIGIVEVIWFWDNDNGKVKPSFGFANRIIAPDATSSIDFNGYGGYGNDAHTITGVQSGIARISRKGTSGFSLSDLNNSDLIPANTTGHNFCRYEDFPSEHSDNIDKTWIEYLTFYCDPDQTSYDFTTYADNPVDANYFKQRLRLHHDGKTYIADTVAGNLSIIPHYPLKDYQHYNSLDITGTVVEETNSSNSRVINLRAKDMIFVNRQTDPFIEYIVYGSDRNHTLQPTKSDQTRRLFWDKLGTFDVDTNDTLYWGSTKSTINKLLGSVDCSKTCNAEFTTPQIDGDIYLQITSEYNSTTYLSDIYTMPVTASRSRGIAPTARINTEYNTKEIRVGMDDSNVSEIFFSAAQSGDTDGSILKYVWDFGNGYGARDGGLRYLPTYDAEGEYTITLTVTDDDGLTDSDTKKIIVTKYALLRLINIDAHATFTVTPYYKEDDNYYYYDYRSGDGWESGSWHLYISRGETIELKLNGGLTYAFTITYDKNDGTSYIYDSEDVYLSAGDVYTVGSNQFTLVVP